MTTPCVKGDWPTDQMVDSVVADLLVEEYIANKRDRNSQDFPPPLLTPEERRRIDALFKKLKIDVNVDDEPVSYMVWPYINGIGYLDQHHRDL